MLSVKNRNKFWEHITSSNEWYSKIIHKDITWEKAIIIEKQEILKYGRHLYEGGSLCNISLGGYGGSMPQKSLEKISKRVYQYSIDDVFIDSYYSVREAGRMMNIGKENIRRCCVGKRKTAKGFKWSYNKK